MLVMKSSEVVRILNSGSKALSFHVINGLGIKSGKAIFEQGLDYAADLKAVSYLNAYRAQHGKYPSVVRFVYTKGENGKDVYLVNKNGEIIL